MNLILQDLILYLLEERGNIFQKVEKNVMCLGSFYVVTHRVTPLRQDSEFSSKMYLQILTERFHHGWYSKHNGSL